MSKYNNKKTLIDGIWFDSKKEANRYVELKMLQAAKLIRNLMMQQVSVFVFLGYIFCIAIKMGEIC